MLPYSTEKETVSFSGNILRHRCHAAQL